MKCICCNKLVSPLHEKLSHEDAVFKTEKNSFKDIEIRAENRMWSDGIVGNVSAGYGSILDGDMFVVAICDDCIIDKVDEGVVAFTGNYMFNFDQSERIESSKKMWRRNNNLDELL